MLPGGSMPVGIPFQGPDEDDRAGTRRGVHVKLHLFYDYIESGEEKGMYKIDVMSKEVMNTATMTTTTTFFGTSLLLT